MPRPLSWLARLHEIRRSVASSIRSHYDRRDLERLFELQPRAAGKLLELLPTVPVGTSRLVERDALARFLERVQEADDTSKFIEQVRQEKSAPSRRSLRTLVRRDAEPASLTALPEGLTLDRGRLEISFRNLEQLAESLVYLARLLDCNLDGFAQAYELEAPHPAETDPAAGEVRALFAELKEREA